MAGPGISARVVMREDDMGSMVAQRNFCDTASIDGNAIDAALSYFFLVEQSKRGIEAKEIKAFVWKAIHERADDLCSRAQRGDALRRLGLGKIPSSGFCDDAKQHGGIFAHALYFLNIQRVCRENAIKRAKSIDEAVRDGVGIDAREEIV